MSFLSKIKIQYYLIFFLAILGLLVAHFYINSFFVSVSDTSSYIQAMEYLQGKSSELVNYNRILTTPLFLYSSIFFSYLTGSLYGGMMIVNLLFYFLIIGVFYLLVLEVYKNHKVATLSSILFLSNYCLYNFGTTYLADIGGWFFFILTSYLALKYYHSNNKRFFFLAILSASIGVLFKEYGALGLISLSTLILISDSTIKSKVKKIFTAGVLFLIIPIAYQLFFYVKFGYSYFDWYFYNLDHYMLEGANQAAKYSVTLLAKVLGWLYLVGWPIFVFGLFQEKKYFDKTRAKILLALLPASLVFLAWPALTQRIAFIFVPWLVLVSGFGLSKIKNKYLLSLILIIYILANYSLTTYLIKVINLPF